MMSLSLRKFQSTHPHGVRPDAFLCWSDFWSVSIHAPTRGATASRANQQIASQFQSTHPHGVRPSISSIVRNHEMFQSTHPHGVRLPACGFSLPAGCGFNPRTHTGCDCQCFMGCYDQEVSIHAPTRGATSPTTTSLPSR